MSKMSLNKITYVSDAEKVIKSLIYTDRNGKQQLSLTTSKIRNILAMISELYTDAIHIMGDKLDEDIQSRLQYLKMRMAYEYGREKTVKSFVEKAKLMEEIDDIKDSKEKLIIYCKYMEALVAYHKYYGGKD